MKGQAARGGKVGADRLYGSPFRPVPIRQIKLHAIQRWWKVPASIRELVTSIRKEGVKERIKVQRLGRQKYCIIDGKKRWKAARIAKLTHIPVTIVKSVNPHDADNVWLDEYCRQPMLPVVDQAITLYEFAQENYRRIKKKEIAELVGWRPAHVSLLITAGWFLRKALLTRSYRKCHRVARTDLPLKLLYAVARLAKMKGDGDGAVELLLEASEPGAKPSDMYEAVCNELYTRKAERGRQKDGRPGTGSTAGKAANAPGGRGRTDGQATERDVAKETIELLLGLGPVDLTTYLDLILGMETPSGTPEAPGSGTRQRPPRATGRALLKQLRSMAEIVAWIEGTPINDIAATEADAQKIRIVAKDLLKKLRLVTRKISKLTPGTVRRMQWGPVRNTGLQRQRKLLSGRRSLRRLVSRSALLWRF